MPNEPISAAPRPTTVPAQSLRSAQAPSTWPSNTEILAALGPWMLQRGWFPLKGDAAPPLGSLAPALDPRDLEGALLLLPVMAVQVLVDPSEGWTRVLPLWSTRELASVVVENLGSETADYLRRGLEHGAAMAVLLTAASWAVGVLRLRTVRPPAPSPAGPAYS